MNQILYPVIVGTQILWHQVRDTDGVHTPRGKDRAALIRAVLANVLPDADRIQIPDPPDASIAADLAIATYVWSRATGRRVDGFFAGSLDVFGQVRPVRGLYNIVADAVDSGLQLTIPEVQYAVAQLAYNSLCRKTPITSKIFTAKSFWSSIVQNQLVPLKTSSLPPPIHPSSDGLVSAQLNSLKDRLQQVVDNRSSALIIAPPNSGVTLAVQKLAGLIPNSPEDIEEIAKIHSLANLLPYEDTIYAIDIRTPLRAPHHTVSDGGLFGTNGLPGEVSLANKGLLFLNRVNEYKKSTLDQLKNVHRAKKVPLREGTFPADFALIGLAHPCPCGQNGQVCICTPDKIKSWHDRIPEGLFEETIQL